MGHFPRPHPPRRLSPSDPEPPRRFSPSDPHPPRRFSPGELERHLRDDDAVLRGLERARRTLGLAPLGVPHRRGPLRALLAPAGGRSLTRAVLRLADPDPQRAMEFLEEMGAQGTETYRYLTAVTGRPGGARLATAHRLLAAEQRESPVFDPRDWTRLDDILTTEARDTRSACADALRIVRAYVDREAGGLAHDSLGYRQLERLYAATPR